MLMIAVLMSCASSVVLAQDVNTKAEMEVIQTARDIGQAWAKHDVATLERLVSDDYTHTDIVGIVQNKDEWLADVRWSAARGLVRKLEFEDLKVRIHGDVAIVTGRNILIIGSSGIVRLPLRFTQVLTKRNGYWQRSAFQAGIAELPRYFLLTVAIMAAITSILLWLGSRLIDRWRRAKR
jgi:ketosteroid isomerase-like protein